MCHVGNTAMWTRSANGGIAGSKCRVFYFRNLSSLIFKAIVERAWAKPRQHVIFRNIALLRGLQLNFISVSSMLLPNRNIWCKLTGWGSSTAESANFLSIEGVT